VKTSRNTLHTFHRDPPRVGASFDTARITFDAADTARITFEAALARISAALPTSHAVFNAADDTLIIANPAFAAEFGTPPPSRSSFEQRFEPVGCDNVAERVRHQDHHAEDGSWVEMFCRRTGRWYAFHWTNIEAPDGATLTLLSVHNVTERVDNMRQHRALQEQLLSSSRVMSVGEMATTLAHEINQPLASIVNCLNAARTLLVRRGAHCERLRQAIDLAHEQAGQAASVVARIREFVRTREPRRESLPLQGMIERIVHLQQLDAQKNRVHVRVTFARGLPPVMVDRVMIEQVLANLMRNGIEAMHTTHPAERTLSIDAFLNSEQRVEVRIADHGPGISLTEEAQLFTPFFTTKPHGMGIGLAICRSIIEFHEGHLYFERVPGSGSVFVFTVPPAQAS